MLSIRPHSEAGILTTVPEASAYFRGPDRVLARSIDVLRRICAVHLVIQQSGGELAKGGDGIGEGAGG